jgi:CheY-like chemotaxis protein
MKFKQENIDQIIEKWEKENFRAEADMYDLIILDLNMPISDGYEACSKILKLYEDN